MGEMIPDIPRGGIYFDPETAASIKKIRKFLDTYTAKGDSVYFFPNEQAYYFLFDKKKPTRFMGSYGTATKNQRRELIMDLEANKPRYVIYSLKTWRVDGIREEVMVPEVVEYLNKRYRPFQDMGDIIFLKRDES